MRTKEYLETVIVSENDVHQMMVAQSAAKTYGFETTNLNRLSEILGGVSVILSLLFKLPIPAQVISALLGLLSVLGSGQVTVENIVEKGIKALGELDKWMLDHPQYDLVKVKMSFLEYSDIPDSDPDTIRFVEDTSPNYIVAVHIKNGGWILNE